MFKIKHSFENLHFLHALGAGGIAISFFMYLMFITKHPETPVPTFESISTSFANGSLFLQGIILIALSGLIIFGIIHFISLIHNISRFLVYKKSDEYRNDHGSQRMAIPLTLGMSMNVIFSLAIVFVPNLWTYIEYLFPVSIFGFLLIGFFAFKMLIENYSQVFSKQGFENDDHNHLSHALPIFALAMIGVGLSGPAAMTHVHETAALALIASLAINSIAILLFSAQFVIGIHNVFKKGWSFEHSPSVWIILPFLTLIGISFIRYEHALHTVIGSPINPGDYFLITTVFISIQIFFGILGYYIMKHNGYFSKYLNEDEVSSSNLSLICPGVAFVVFGFFFIHKGLIQNNIITQSNLMYIILIIAVVLVQIQTIYTYISIHRKFIKIK